MTGGGGIYGKNYSQTSTSGTTSIVDTGVIPNAGIYEIFVIGNANAGGSGAYRSTTNGYLHITVDFTNPNIVTEIRYIEVAKTGGGSSDITLNVDAKILLSGTEYSEINYSDKDSAQIRIKVSNYAGTVGNNQEVRLIRKI